MTPKNNIDPVNITITNDYAKNYWINQPVDVITHKINVNQPTDTTNVIDTIKIINSGLIQKQSENLPNGFKFKTLGLNHLDEIFSLLNNHYIEDDQHIIRITYSKDFLYWYLKYVPAGFIVGLLYNNKLVGMITAIFMDMIVYEKEIKVPYINFLCLQSKIRKLGLGLFLIEEIKSRLTKIKITYALFTGMKPITKPFCTSNDFVIPVNYPKLKAVDFLQENLTPIPKLDNNPLHLMMASDIDSLIPKLNKCMEKLSVKPYFTNESAHHFLLPKKNIVYSFVNRNTNHEVTDYVTVYKTYIYCKEKNKIISVARLAFYYHETMTLTDLITNLLDKLPSYDIDQLLFSNTFDNAEINITKFSTYGQLHYFFYNVSINETMPSKLCFFPI